MAHAIDMSVFERSIFDMPVVETAVVDTSIISVDTSLAETVVIDTSIIPVDTSIVETAVIDTSIISVDTSLAETVVIDTSIISVDTSLAETVVIDTSIIPVDTSHAETVVIDTSIIFVDTSIVETAVIDTSIIPVDTSLAETAVIDTSIIPVDTSTIQKTTAVESDEPTWPKRLRWGRRVAYNNASVTGLSTRVYSFDGQSLTYTEYGHEAVHAYGFEVSAILFFSVSDAVAFHISPALLFRKPLSTRYAGIGEVALSFPLLVEWSPFSAVPLHALAGIQPDLPMYTRLMWRSEPLSDSREPHVALGERSPLDFGFVLGVGGYINRKAAVDVRAIIGLLDFDRVPGRRLNQFTVGINYIR